MTTDKTPLSMVVVKSPTLPNMLGTASPWRGFAPGLPSSSYSSSSARFTPPPAATGSLLFVSRRRGTRMIPRCTGRCNCATWLSEFGFSQGLDFKFINSFFFFSSKWDHPRTTGALSMRPVTFEDIRINDGGGMHLNGSFIAPIDGVYW